MRACNGARSRHLRGGQLKNASACGGQLENAGAACLRAERVFSSAGLRQIGILAFSVELAQVIALGGIGLAPIQAMHDAACRTTEVGACRRSNGEQEMSHALKSLKLLIGLLALLSLPVLSGCNTARGVGEDVQAAGHAMSSTAEKAEEKMTGEPDKPKTGTTQ